MPRDSSGNYTLPSSGNPVVTGSTISSSWANTTLNDIATEMTDSLDRSGKGGMLAPFKIQDGTVSAPGIAFQSETGTGIYRITAGELGIATLGALRIQVGPNGNITISAGGGTTLTVGGASAQDIAIFNGGSGAAVTQADVVITRAGSTANAQQQGPNITLSDTTNATASVWQNSGGQTELYQLNSSTWKQIIFVDSSGAVNFKAASTTNNAVTINGSVGHNGLQINGSSTAGSSYGLGIAAGLDSSDAGLRVFNQTNSTQYFQVRGDGLVSIVDDGGTLQIAGYRGTPNNSQSSNYTLQLSDRGKAVATGTNGITFTVPSGVFSSGDVVTFIVDSGATVTVAQGSGMTIKWAGNGSTTGNRTLTGAAMAALAFSASGTGFLSGAGVT